jgi:ubiquitin carboxyl-terminal hydrolase 25/28
VLASPNWLQSAYIDDDLKKDLDSRRGEITTEILAAELEVKRLKDEVEAIWEGDSLHEYELASVFMHRGDASFGHYYLYQRNLPNEPETFFKYKFVIPPCLSSSLPGSDSSIHH